MCLCFLWSNTQPIIISFYICTVRVFSSPCQMSTFLQVCRFISVCNINFICIFHYSQCKPKRRACMCFDSKTHSLQLEYIYSLNFIKNVFQVDSRYIGSKGLGVAWWWGWWWGWATWLKLCWRVNSGYRKRKPISLARFPTNTIDYLRIETVFKDDIYSELKKNSDDNVNNSYLCYRP